MIRLAATGLTCTAGRATLLEDVSLHVEGGELIAVVGPNGAGKTTLLRSLAGEIVPQSGAVLVDGSDASTIHPAELSLIRAFLQGGGPADMPFSARQIVALGRHPHRHDPRNSSARDEQMIDQAMSLAEVDALAHRVFATLSGGEQMRVSVARLLAQDTPLLLLDEPTGPLDVSHRERLLGRLGSLAASGRCIVVALHDLNTAAAHATRVALMSNGQIVADGSAGAVLTPERLSEVYRHPMHVVEHPVSGGPLVLAARNEEAT